MCDRATLGIGSGKRRATYSKEGLTGVKRAARGSTVDVSAVFSPNDFSPFYLLLMTLLVFPSIFQILASWILPKDLCFLFVLFSLFLSLLKFSFSQVSWTLVSAQLHRQQSS